MSKEKRTRKVKHIKPTCEHLDWDNKHDCTHEAEYVCMCCGAGVCQEHKTSECPYGGMGFIEL